MKVSIWCSECCEFHDAVQDKDYDNIWIDQCSGIVSITDVAILND